MANSVPVDKKPVVTRLDVTLTLEPADGEDDKKSTAWKPSTKELGWLFGIAVLLAASLFLFAVRTWLS